MALSKSFSATRGDLGNSLGSPQTRGLVFNGMQTEACLVTKLAGDSAGSIDIVAVQRPKYVFLIVLEGSGGSLVASKDIQSVTFTHTDNDTIALSGLSDWTTAMVFVCGRSFDFAPSS